MVDVVGTAVVKILPDTTGFAAATSAQMAGANAALGATGAAAARVAGGPMAKLGTAFATSGQKAALLATQMRGLTIGLGLFAAAGIKTAIDYDTSMRRVSAITNGTNAEMEMLNKTAQKLGRDTQFTASQAADAMYKLALSGFKVNEINDAAPGVLRLAAAGYVDLSEAADMAAMTLRSYQFQANQIGRVNDVLANTFTRTNTDLRSLFDAFKYVGPIAKVAGVNFEEVNSALGLMADAGFRGTLGGTALRGAMMKLLNPTKEGEKVLKKYGIVAKTASGELLPLVDIIRQFEKANVTAADYVQLFAQRAGPGFAALVGQGSEKLEQQTNSNKMAGKEVQTLTKYLDLNKKEVFALTAAFTKSFPNIDRFGFSMDDAAAVLASFVQQGKSADEATMLLSGAMQAISTKGFEKMIGATRDLEGRLIDSNGEVMTMIDVVAALQSKGLTTAESLSILGESGKALAEVVQMDVGELSKMVTETDKAGRAAEIMKTQMEGIKGAGLRLKSSLEAVGIVLFYETGFLDAVAKAADGVAVALNKLMETSPGLVKVFGGLLIGVALIGPLARLYSWLVLGAKAMFNFVKAFALFPVKHPIVAAIMLIVGSLVLMWKNSEKLRNAFSTFAKVFGKLWEQVFGGDNQKKADDTGKKVEKTASLFERLGKVFGKLGDAIAPAVLWLSDRLPAAFNAVEVAFQRFQQGYDRYVAPVIDTIIRAFNTVKRVVGDGFANAFSGFNFDFSLEGLQDIGGRILEGLKAAVPAIGAGIAEIVSMIGASLSTAQVDFGTFYDRMTDGLTNIPVIGNLAQMLGSAIQGQFESLGGFVDIAAGLFTWDTGRMAEGVGKLWNGILITLQQSIPAAISALGDLFTDVLGGALGWAAEAVKNLPIFGTILTGLFDGLKAAAETLGGTFDLVSALIRWDPAAMGEAAAAIGNGLLGLLSGIGEMLVGVDPILDWLEGMLMGLGDKVKNIPFIGPLVNSLIGLLRGAGDLIGAGTDLLGGLFTWDMDTIKKGLGGIFEAASSFVFDGLGNAFAAVGQGANKLGEFLGMFLSNAGQWVSKNLPKLLEFLGDIPDYIAEWLGGLFSGGGGGKGGGGGGGKGGGKGRGGKGFGDYLVSFLRDGMGGLLAGLGELSGGLLKFLWEVISSAIMGLPELIWDLISGLASILWELIKLALKGLWNLGGILLDAFAAGFGWLVDNAPGLLLNLAGWLIGIPGQMLGWLGDLGGVLLGWLGKAWDWLAENGPTILANVGAWLATVPGMLLGFLGDIGSTLLGWITAGWDWLVENGPGILTNIGAWLVSIPGQLLGWLGDIGSLLLGWITAGWNWLVENGPIILTNVSLWLVSLPGQILGWLGDLGSKLVEWITGAWNWVKDNGPTILTNVISWITGIPTLFISGLGSIGSKLFDWLKKGFDYVKDNGPRLLSGVVSFFASIPGKLFDAITGALGAAGAVGGKVLDFGAKLWGSIKDFINQKLIDPIKGVTILGAKPFGFLPRLADGDIVLGPTQAIIGEAGPEVVVPLSDTRTLTDYVAGRANFTSGIVNRPTTVTLGQQPEVVLPLSRPARAKELALKALGATGAGRAAAAMSRLPMYAAGAIFRPGAGQVKIKSMDEISPPSGFVKAMENLNSFAKTLKDAKVAMSDVGVRSGSFAPRTPAQHLTLMKGLLDAGFRGTFYEDGSATMKKKGANTFRLGAYTVAGEPFVRAFLSPNAQTKFVEQFERVHDFFIAAKILLGQGTSILPKGDGLKVKDKTARKALKDAGFDLNYQPIVMGMDGKTKSGGFWRLGAQKVTREGLNPDDPFTLLTALPFMRAMAVAMVRRTKEITEKNFAEKFSEMPRVVQNQLASRPYEPGATQYPALLQASLLPRIGAFADGGMITGPQIGLIGEAGPEVVIPLTRPGRALELAAQSGLFEVLDNALARTSPVAVTSPPAAGDGAPMAGTASAAGGGILGGGPGNTYNIYGVSMEQVEAEIRVRDAAAVRVRR